MTHLIKFHNILLTVSECPTVHVTCYQLRDPTNLWTRDPLSKTFTLTEGPQKNFIFGGYPEAVFVGVNRPALEDENSPASSA